MIFVTFVFVTSEKDSFYFSAITLDGKSFNKKFLNEEEVFDYARVTKQDVILKRHLMPKKDRGDIYGASFYLVSGW